MEETQQDVFISHASRDKDQYVYPLTAALSSQDVTFWLDDAQIELGDSVAGRIDEGLRTSRFALVCLSRNFLQSAWSEAEMYAVLAFQNSAGTKRVLPVILNSKEEVLRRYPLLSGLRFGEFSDGTEKLAAEIAKRVKRKDKQTDEIVVTVESIHTGKVCHLRVPRRASVKWLAGIARSGMEMPEALKFGQLGKFYVRFVLVDVNAEDEWRKMARSEKRAIYALIAADNEVKASFSMYDRLDEIGVTAGTIFHLHIIEDEDHDLSGGDVIIIK